MRYEVRQLEKIYNLILANPTCSRASQISPGFQPLTGQALSTVHIPGTKTTAHINTPPAIHTIRDLALAWGMYEILKRCTWMRTGGGRAV